MTRKEAIEELKTRYLTMSQCLDKKELHNANNALEMAIKALEQTRWIPVSERLPEEAGMYLCSYDDNDVGTSYFDISMNEFNIFHEQVTAWMYLPEPHKQEVEV